MSKIENKHLIRLGKELETMPSSISKMVLAETDGEVLCALTYSDRDRLVSVLANQMKMHDQLAKVIMAAADEYRGTSAVQTDPGKEPLEDLLASLKRLPSDASAFTVVKLDQNMIIHAQGSPVGISAMLCSAQEREGKVQAILEVAVEGYRLATSSEITDIFKSSKQQSDVN